MSLDARNKICINWFIVAAIISKFLFEYIYVLDIVPFFSYAGFTSINNEYNRIFGWLIFAYFTLLILPFLYKPESTTSQAVILLYFFRILPFSVLCTLKFTQLNYILTNVLFWSVFILLAKLMPRPKLPNIKYNSNVLLYCLVTIMAATIIYISIKYTGFRLSIDISNIYDYRMEARGFDIPLILQYIYGPAGNILPVFMTYFIIQKKWKWVIFIMFIGLINFSIAGSKSVLAKMLFCLILGTVVTHSYLKITIKLIVILLVCTICLHYVSTFNVLSAIIIRRVFFIPVLLDSYYYEFISLGSPTMFSGALNSDLPFIIGEKYFPGHEGMRCNNGLFTDAYSNMGLVGCLVMPCIYVAFIKMCDSAFKNVNGGVAFFAIIMIVTTISSSFFTTALFTHGLLLLWLSMYILGSIKKNTLNLKLT